MTAPVHCNLASCCGQIIHNSFQSLVKQHSPRECCNKLRFSDKLNLQTNSSLKAFASLLSKDRKFLSASGNMPAVDETDSGDLEIEKDDIIASTSISANARQFIQKSRQTADKQAKQQVACQKGPTSRAEPVETQQDSSGQGPHKEMHIRKKQKVEGNDGQNALDRRAELRAKQKERDKTGPTCQDAISQKARLERPQAEIKCNKGVIGVSAGKRNLSSANSKQYKGHESSEPKGARNPKTTPGQATDDTTKTGPSHVVSTSGNDDDDMLELDCELEIEENIYSNAHQLKPVNDKDGQEIRGTHNNAPKSRLPQASQPITKVKNARNSVDVKAAKLPSAKPSKLSNDKQKLNLGPKPAPTKDGRNMSNASSRSNMNSLDRKSGKERLSLGQSNSARREGVPQAKTTARTVSKTAELKAKNDSEAGRTVLAELKEHDVWDPKTSGNTILLCLSCSILCSVKACICLFHDLSLPSKYSHSWFRHLYNESELTAVTTYLKLVLGLEQLDFPGPTACMYCLLQARVSIMNLSNRRFMN